jgi:hypothetical protein
MFKAYLAARFSRYPEMVEKADVLEDYGIIVNSRWIRGNHELHEGTDMRDYDFNQKCAYDDLEDIREAELFITFTEKPNADFAYSRGGRHVEYGYALALDKDIHVIGPRENVFHYVEGVTYWSSWAAFLDFVREYYILEID